jgi:uncharacterized protein YdeI (YjbR/CyaY-like superfamily)
MVELDMVDIRTGQQWRAWLRKNHKSSPGVWVICHKEHTGVPSIPYEELIREALCFGWIDSLVKRLDDNRYARKVTPRKQTSKWSDLNRRRWAELHAAGLLDAAGTAAAPTENSYAPKPTIPESPPYIITAFKADPKAWAFFQTLPAGERRNFVVWIHIAKREETRERRLREAVRLLARGKKLGLK